MAKTRFKPDMINSAPTSVECEVCHARLATTTVVEFIRACGLCAKKIEDLIQRKHILAHVVRLFRLQQLSGAPNDQRLKNLHRRLVEVEAEIRALKRGGAR